MTTEQTVEALTTRVDALIAAVRRLDDDLRQRVARVRVVLAVALVALAVAVVAVTTSLVWTNIRVDDHRRDDIAARCSSWQVIANHSTSPEIRANYRQLLDRHCR